MDMKKMLAALDGVESAEGTASSVAQKGSMKSLLESLDSVVAEEETMEVESAGPVDDLVDELADQMIDELGSQQLVLQELVRYLDGDTLADFVVDFRRHHDMTQHEAVGDSAKLLYDLVDEVAITVADELSSHKLVLDELVRYLDGATKEDFVAHFRRHHDMNEGKMSDQLIHDSETMSKEDFTKKYGKFVADEYFESVNEVVAEEELEEAIMVSAEGGEAAELLAILQNAGMSAPAMPAMPEPEMDMQDEYSNSPDEQEMDLDAVIASGDDLNRSKKQYAASADGDNPMKAFEGKFQSILDELLAEDEVVVEDEVVEAQSPAQKAAFQKMLDAKKDDSKDDDADDEDKVDETVEVNESSEFSDIKHFMKRLNG